ncbi:LOW QUALITY PROTEIN: hypothetical protein Q4I32_003644 [Leishmania shawi]|uniref:Uncharacterized protein n=1 Tax=Leishmania shawi TaxID=5680 RepID=A0AAW3BVP7_9TRYP
MNTSADTHIHADSAAHMRTLFLCPHPSPSSNPVDEGATFHLLCEDAQQTLAALVKLQECSISQTLHVSELETWLAGCIPTECNRCGAAKNAAWHDDDSAAGSSPPIHVGTASRLSWQRRAYMRSTSPAPRHIYAPALVSGTLLNAAEAGGDDRQASGVSTRVLPLPIVEANTYLVYPPPT